ncbi:MAG: tyrosine kinase family protein [Betaproteobacteria bacterium]|nr:tyrosine kinase family protein [Betaproteobacteria bacterium]
MEPDGKSSGIPQRPATDGADEITQINPGAPKHRGIRTTDVTGLSYSELRSRARLNPGHEEDRVGLPVNFMLLEYRIESVLGIGGFGVTYMVHDTLLNNRVAIKEYLPNDLAVRDDQTGAVSPKSKDAEENYETGLDRFVLEARTLAAFHHPNIVGVNRFFEANNTAYMVMVYEFGESLNSWMKKYLSRSDGAPDQASIMRMFVPLLEGLQKIHDTGFLHRDIKPANIYVRDADGSLVLLDFGAARQIKDIDSAEGLTSIVTPGYAPFEQYHAHGRQGPWSDIYALGGVLYWIVTGKKPVEAAARIETDPQKSAVDAGRGRYGEAFLKAIDWALAPHDRNRPQTVAVFLAALVGTQLDGKALALSPPPLPGDMERQSVASRSPGRRRAVLAGVAAASVAAVAAALFATLRGGPGSPLRLAIQTGAVAQSAAETGEWTKSMRQFSTLLGEAVERSVETVQIADFSREMAQTEASYDLYLGPVDKIGIAVGRLRLTPLAKFRDFAVSIIVKSNSGVEKIAQLEGHSIATYPANSAHGPILMHYLLTNDVRIDQIALKLSGSPDAMVDALLFGVVDAVALAQYGADDALARYGNKLKVIGKSDSYPGFVLAAAPKVSSEQVARLEQTLLGLQNTSAGIAALKSIRIRQTAGTLALMPTSATEVAGAAERLDHARSLFPKNAVPLDAKAAPGTNP